MADNAQEVHIRRVTNVHADFDDEGPGGDGVVRFQFILDDGAEEYVMTPTISPGRLILAMIRDAETLLLDTERGRLVLRGLD